MHFYQISTYTAYLFFGNCTIILLRYLANIFLLNAYYVSDILLSTTNEQDKDPAPSHLHTTKQLNSLILGSNRCCVDVKQGNGDYLGKRAVLESVQEGLADVWAENRRPKASQVIRWKRDVPGEGNNHGERLEAGTFMMGRTVWLESSKAVGKGRKWGWIGGGGLHYAGPYWCALFLLGVLVWE